MLKDQQPNQYIFISYTNDINIHTHMIYVYIYIYTRTSTYVHINTHTNHMIYAYYTYAYACTHLMSRLCLSLQTARQKTPQARGRGDFVHDPGLRSRTAGSDGPVLPESFLWGRILWG